MRFIFLLILLFATPSFAQTSNIPPGGVLSSNNSTQTPVVNGDSFEGFWDTNSFPDAFVRCKADQDGKLYVDFKYPNGDIDTFPPSGWSVSANIAEPHTFVKASRDMRIRFLNDSGEDQSSLVCYTYYGTFEQLSAPNNLAMTLDSDAKTVRPTIPQDEIRIGRRTGVTGWTKFAESIALTAATGDQIIWTSSGSFVPMESASAYTITYNASTDGLGTTGATQLTFFHVDENGNPETIAHTLSNTGSDTTSFTGFGINRIAVSSTGTADVNTNAITIKDASGNLQAHVPAGLGVTEQAIFVNGANHKAICYYIRGSAIKLTGSNPVIEFEGWIYNRLVDSKFRVFDDFLDTAVDNHFEVDDTVGFVLNEGDTLYFTADTDTNDALARIRFSCNQYQND